MKRKRCIFLLLAAGLISAEAARAECQIQLSESQVNYGQMNRGDLLTLPGNSLTSGELRFAEEYELGVTIHCDRPTPLALQFIGPLKDSDSYRFGKNGRATLILHDVMIDDRQVQIASARNRDVSMAFPPGSELWFWKEGGPVTGTTLHGKVSIISWIPSDETRVNERQNWQLNGSFVVGGTG